MNRFILQESETPGSWVCTDTVNKIVCVFVEHKFNETQKFTTLEDFEVSQFQNLARYTREMGDWLKENHYEKIF